MLSLALKEANTIKSYYHAPEYRWAYEEIFDNYSERLEKSIKEQLERIGPNADERHRSNTINKAREYFENNNRVKLAQTNGTRLERIFRNILKSVDWTVDKPNVVRRGQPWLISELDGLMDLRADQRKYCLECKLYKPADCLFGYRS